MLNIKKVFVILLIESSISQEYLISTVGSHIAHPDKNKIDIADNSKLDTLSEESARFNAQHKRNVSQTATMKEYQLNNKTPN